jgi:DNA polymerase
MGRHAPYLREMGLVQWRHVSQVRVEPAGSSGVEVTAKAGCSQEAANALSALADDAAACERCDLCRTRNQTVFGVGSPRARWLFVGEAPGAEEDKQGMPFVGRAGALLSAMLFSIGLSREDVYIANVLKCRPPNNRDPLGREVRECSFFLHQQISWVQPEIIVAMGRFAAQALLETDQSLGQLRGHSHKYKINELPLVVTYHPAYLLRSPSAKGKSWEDLTLAQSIVD